MEPDDEARDYISEMKKKGIRLLKIADKSPEELEKELFVSHDVAQAIISLARKELLKKMEQKSGGDKLRMLPHVGQKRAKILHEHNMNFKKLAEMSPEELMKLVPRLRRSEAEDIIIAAEIKLEESTSKKEKTHDSLFKLPYMSASRRRHLIKNGLSIADIAKLKPEELMQIIPGLQRKQAEQMIIAAELMVEEKAHKKSRKAPRPEIIMQRNKVKRMPPGRMKKGLVNGNSLVNGRGVVNGLGIAPVPQKHSKLPVLIIALAIFLSALIPMFMFAPAHEIVIDGHFSDWSSVPGAYDPFGTADGNLVEVKGFYASDTLYVYAKFTTSIFKDAEGLFIFIDSDHNASTGYTVGSLGADYMIRITGWNNTLHQHGIYRYTGNSPDNWSAFVSYAAPKIGFKGTQIEISADISSGTGPEFMVVAKRGSNEDMNYIPIAPEMGGVFVYAFSNTPRTISNFQTVEKIRIYPYGSPHLHLHLVPFGEFHKMNYTLRVINDNEQVVNQGAWVNLTVRNNITLNVQVRVSGRGSIGFHVFSPDDTVNVLNNVSSVAVGNFSGIRVDGNFTDWTGVKGTYDPKGDVEPAINYTHENIDLKEVKRFGDYFYIQTYAPILAGDVVPEIVKKTFVDSDRDTVPDYLDPYPHDFNNDGIPDNESYVMVDGKKLPDVDGDGIADYPYGPDMWLNTTIPSWFPKPYAGRHVSVYIGPVPKIKITGNDTFMVFIEDRNGSYHAPFLPFKSSHMVLISGRGFDASAYLERYDGQRWHKEKKIDFAFAGTQLEGNATLQGKIFVLAVDWLKQRDLENQPSKQAVEIKQVNYTPELGAIAGATDLIVNGTTRYVNESTINRTVVVENGGTLIINFNSTMTAVNFYVNNTSKVIVNGSTTINITTTFYIDSTSIITANGTGYAGGTGGSSSSGSAGAGTGGGQGGEVSSYTALGGGGGGGGYGNAGGAGGDLNIGGGASGGLGGVEYGNATDFNISQGSGGGGGGGAGGAGGAGGGCIAIYSNGSIDIYGAIYANGASGASALYGGGGGGGSGGGILIYGVNVSLYSTSIISAAGGNGGNSTYSGGGGSGSGGRIKIFYVNTLQNASSFNVSSGVPGTTAITRFSTAGNAGGTGTISASKVPEFSDAIYILLPLFVAFTALRETGSHSKNGGEKDEPKKEWVRNLKKKII